MGSAILLEIQKPGQGHSHRVTHTARDWGVPGTLGPNCRVLYRWPMGPILMLGDGKQWPFMPQFPFWDTEGELPQS